MDDEEITQPFTSGNSYPALVWCMDGANGCSIAVRQSTRRESGCVWFRSFDSMITRRRFLKASAAAVGLGAVAGIYTWRIEPHWLEVVERRLSIAGLPQDLAGLQLVQLSDLHVGPRVDDDYLLRCFHRVKELAPAFVVYTGDFTSHEPQVFDHARRMFSHLPLGRRGTFGILGNHAPTPIWAILGSRMRDATS